MGSGSVCQARMTRACSQGVWAHSMSVLQHSERDKNCTGISQMLVLAQCQGANASQCSGSLVKRWHMYVQCMFCANLP